VSAVQKTDFIIVGQGLAGSVLALQLTEAGKSVIVIDNDVNYSSRVAAGLFNPVTGKTLSKTWMADEIFAQLFQFYTQAEKIINASFFYPKPIYRPFLSIEEQNEWMGKSVEGTWSPFIEKALSHSAGFEGVKDPFGGLLLKQTGYINTQSFLLATKNFFSKKNQFINDTFDYTCLHIRQSEVVYKNLSAEKIIFCEGVDILNNRFFSWVPVRVLKGETITIEAILPVEAIINRGVYAVPVGKNIFKIGATYETKELSHTATERAKEELKSKLEQIFSLPYTVTNQEWGLRPTTPDRRPVIGEHPEYNRVLVYNGLGTKGVSLAPFIGSFLTTFLLAGNKPATYTSVDVNRYNSLYWKAQ